MTPRRAAVGFAGCVLRFVSNHGHPANRRIKIRKSSTELDEYGDPIPGWQTVAIFWGDVRLLSGLETVRANVAVSEVKASIRIRYLAGIDASMVAEVSGKTYDIEAVLPDVRDREFIDLLCKAKT